MDANLITEDMIYLREMEPTETASDYLNKYIKAEIIPLANNTIADLKAEIAKLNTEIANLKIDLAKKERDQAESAVLKTNIEVRATMEEVRQAISKIKDGDLNRSAASTSGDNYEVTFKLDKLLNDTEDIQRTLKDVDYNVSRLSDDIKNNDENRIDSVVPNNISSYPEANLVTNIEPAPVEIQNIVSSKEEFTPTDIESSSVEDIKPTEEVAPIEENSNQEIVPNDVPTEEENSNKEEEDEMVSAGVNPEDKPQYDLPTDTIKPEENVISSIPNADNVPLEENVAQAEGNNNIYPEGNEIPTNNTIEESNESHVENSEESSVENSAESAPAFDGDPYTPAGTKIGRSALEEIKTDIYVVKTPDVIEEVSHFPQELKDRLDGLLGVTNEVTQETTGRSR